MALLLEHKKTIVSEVNGVAGDAMSVVAADYRGLTSPEMTDLRAKARKDGVQLRIVRNTLAKIALKDTSHECLSEVLTGPTILAFSNTEPGAGARLVKDFAKDHEALNVKALSLGDALLGPEQLDKIASLPNREEAIAQLMAVMKAPIEKFVRTLAEPHSKLVRTVAAIRDKKS